MVLVHIKSLSSVYEHFSFLFLASEWRKTLRELSQPYPRWGPQVGELTPHTVRESDYQNEEDVAHRLPLNSRTMESLCKQGSTA